MGISGIVGNVREMDMLPEEVQITAATREVAKDTLDQMSKVQMTEQGWPGHYCCADQCMFRRNTLLTLGDRRVIVSSVGNRRDDKGVIVEIGSERYYETMAFEAVKTGVYWSVNVDRQIYFRGRCAITQKELHLMGGDADMMANYMHDNAVFSVGIDMIEEHVMIYGDGSGEPMGILPK